MISLNINKNINIMNENKKSNQIYFFHFNKTLKIYLRYVYLTQLNQKWIVINIIEFMMFYLETGCSVGPWFMRARGYLIHWYGTFETNTWRFLITILILFGRAVRRNWGKGVLCPRGRGGGRLVKRGIKKVRWLLLNLDVRAREYLIH